MTTLEGIAQFKRPALLSLLGLACALSANAQICDLTTPPIPKNFPDQPINIFIPRSSASGSLGLNEKIADSIRNLTDQNGDKLNIQVNTLFRFGGDMNVALDYFLDLPPNGYNVIQLTDTYASLLASAPPVADRLVPISLSQITLSQLYIRRDDPNFSDLGSFLRYANEPRQDGRDDPVKIALFGTPGDQFGLEDILLKKFAGLYAEQGAEPQVVALPDGAVTDPAADPVQQTDSSRSDIQPARFESGSERYFSLFGASLGSDRQVDALIEQPGDVARLLDGGLLKPIFTFLPERDLDTGAAAELRERLGATPSFPQQDSEECAVYYRFRGFFIPTDVPPDRRAFLEWVFRKAFDSESFHEFNRREYMDVLYLDDSITDSYCSTPHLAQFFQQSVQEYRECLSELNLAGTGP